MDITGPDISNHQGQVDWDKAVASGLVQFAIAKASEGVRFVDAWFPRNWAEMKRKGLPRGAYHYALPSENSPKDEAAFFWQRVVAAGGVEPGDMLWLDQEDPDFPVGADAGTWSLLFLQELERLCGFTPGIYTYPSYVTERKLTHPGLARFPLWYADYDGTEGPVRGPWGPPDLWQYTSEKVIPGIGSRIDHNIFHGTVADLRALGKPGGAVKVPIEPEAADVKEPAEGEFTAYQNAQGNTIFVWNAGGTAVRTDGIAAIDLGLSVENAAGEKYDRSIQNNVVQKWNGPR